MRGWKKRIYQAHRVARLERFELPTHGSEDHCSIH